MFRMSSRPELNDENVKAIADLPGGGSLREREIFR